MLLHDHLRVLLGERRVDEVAQAVGVARSAVYAWLAGQKIPSTKNLTALLRELGHDPDDSPETWDLYVKAQRSRTAA